MTNRYQGKTTSANKMRLLAVLALLASIWFGSLLSTADAQVRTSDVAIVATENGFPVYDACFVLVNYSNVGCDDNGDGKVTFRDVPLGTYTVSQTANLGPNRSIPSFTIRVTGATDYDGWERFYTNVVGTSGGFSDVAIVTTENGFPVYDACFVLVNFSNVGCDDNRDGKITFRDIPLGTYTVRQTANLGLNRYVPDFTIRVSGSADSDGWERFYANVVGASGGSTISGEVDIALITRDPNTGDLLTDTCYVLVGFSNVGCDENGDGQVTFAAIPYGTYTVRQTKTPAGYPTINDYEIFVAGLEGAPGMEPFDVPLGFVVKQAPEQNLPGTSNVSVILIDMNTQEKVVAEICAEFVGASNVGCDDKLHDGQIDFLDLPAGGPYEVRFSNVPAGYVIYEEVVGGEPISVYIEDTPSMMSNRFMFVLLAAG